LIFKKRLEKAELRPDKKVKFGYIIGLIMWWEKDLATPKITKIKTIKRVI